MNSEPVWPLFPASLLVVWMTFHSCRGGFNCPRFTWNQLRGMGLYRLMGTVKYPTQATPRSLNTPVDRIKCSLVGEWRAPAPVSSLSILPSPLW